MSPSSPMPFLTKNWKLIAAAVSALATLSSEHAQLKQNSRDVEHLLVKEKKVDDIFTKIFERGVRVDNIQENELKTLAQTQEDIRDLRDEVRLYAAHIDLRLSSL